MPLEETIDKLKAAFAEVENTANSFTDEQFFKKPDNGKWSAAEHVQHLFLSAKPLVGLFGKPELMLQFGKRNRPSMNDEGVVNLYTEKLKGFATSGIVNNVSGLSATRAEQVANLHSIHEKFLERAAGLPDDILDEYQIPHPLLGLLTVREFVYFTRYHTLHHTKTIAALK